MRAPPSLTLLGILAAAFLLAGCEFFPEPPGEKYALVYGISVYDNDYLEYKDQKIDTNPNLSYTDDDAMAIAQMLDEKGYTVYLRETGDSTDPGGTIQYSGTTSPTQLENDIIMFEGMLNKNDTFLFYFSGHGASGQSISGSKAEDSLSDSSEEYIILNTNVDEIIYDDAQNNGDFYSDDSFYQQIRSLPSLRNIVIIDACNSGGFIGQRSDVDITAPEYYEENKTRSNSLGLILNSYFTPDSGDIPPEEAIVMTASGEQEVSLENPDFKHGIFTYYLLHTPQNDLNGDGVITTGEAYGYIRYALVNWWSDDFSESARRVDLQYYPRISGGPVDYVLFKAD